MAVVRSFNCANSEPIFVRKQRERLNRLSRQRPQRGPVVQYSRQPAAHMASLSTHYWRLHGLLRMPVLLSGSSDPLFQTYEIVLSNRWDSSANLADATRVEAYKTNRGAVAKYLRDEPIPAQIHASILELSRLFQRGSRRPRRRRPALRRRTGAYCLPSRVPVSDFQVRSK
jgi:hypothetical protein